MLIAINIGNSSIRFGIFKGDQFVESWIINSKIQRTEDEFYTLFRGYCKQYNTDESMVRAIVIGSVVPVLTQPVSLAIERVYGQKPIKVDRSTPSPVFHTSTQLGTDLYANAVEAYYSEPQKNKLVVDFGTALTFTAINAEGVMQGIAIAPGMNTALQALVGNAAQLNEVPLVAPKEILGKDTVSCIQSGLVYGYLSMIEGMITRIKRQMPGDTYVIATGGLCHIYEKMTSFIDRTDKAHTIKGLKRLYDINS